MPTSPNNAPRPPRESDVRSEHHRSASAPHAFARLSGKPSYAHGVVRAGGDTGPTVVELAPEPWAAAGSALGSATAAGAA